MESSGTSEMYSSLSRAKLTRAYLHTNSTTHEFLFGALAELVDNARDASSKRIDIYTEPAESFRGKFMLCFRDDGDGMDQSEVANVIQFGRSIKRKVDQHMIGQYGNGLKSGTMRIAQDMILFSKKNNSLNCLFISRTFHDRENIDEVVVPMPSWDGTTKRPLLRDGQQMKQHQFELNIILQYSPFKTEKTLLAEFDKLESTGTLVIVYNMKLMDNNEPQLDVKSDPYDIKMADPNAGEQYCDDESVVPERKSFRAYSAVLYLDPKMKIYIQHKKVQTKRLITGLYKPKLYQFTSNRFKRRSEKEAEKAEQEYLIAQERARELEIQDKELREQPGKMAKLSLVEQRKKSQALVEARTAANMKQKSAEIKKKSLKDPKTLNFIYGINLEQRKCYGVMLYNCGRLIKMYEKVGCQMEGGMKGYGVLGIVDVPYLVLEPTHNKQDFADHKEFKSLTRALGDHLDHYWKECPIATCSQGVAKFWEAYGYVSTKWKDGPSNESKYLRKRAMDLPIYAQCDKCLKWRELAFHSSLVGKELSDEWCCRDNSNAENKHCHLPEKKVSIPKAMLKKVVKSAEEQRKILEEEMKKKQEKLEQLEKRTGGQPSTSRSSVEEPPARRLSQPVVQLPTMVQPRTHQVILPKPVSTPAPARPSPVQVRLPRSQPRPAPAPRQPVQAPAPKQPVQTSRNSTTPKKNKAPSINLHADSTESVSKSQQNLKRPLTGVSVKQETQPTAKRKKQDTTAELELRVPKDTEMEWNSDSSVPSPPQHEPDITILQGRVCEGKTENNEWHFATIVAVKQKDGVTKVRAKFRDHPKDKFDKWYVFPSPDISLLQQKGDQHLPQTKIPPSSIQTVTPNATSPPPLPSSPSIELPSTTTSIDRAVALQALPDQVSPHVLPEQSSPVRSPDTVSSVAEREETQHQIADLLRSCLTYFIPEDFNMTKAQIRGLSDEELRNFPMTTFQDKYHETLIKHLSDNTAQKEEAEKKCEEMERLKNEIAKQKEEAEKKCEEMERLKNEIAAQKEEAERRCQEMERSRDEIATKLSELRSYGVRLIRSLGNDEHIELDDPERVDVTLADLARQAEEQYDR